MRLRNTILVLGFLFLAASCGGTDNNIENDLQIDRSKNTFKVLFSPGDGVLPFPSNLLFSGTQDLTLNIPVADASDFSNPQVALNSLDGFSTIAPIRAEFNLAVDASTLTAQTVHLYEVTLSGFAGGVTSVVRELGYGTEFTAGVSPVDTTGKTMVISPLRPLKPKTHYMVALTNGIQSKDGRVLGPDGVYKTVKQTTPLVNGSSSLLPILTDADATALEPLRQLTNAQEAALASQGLNSDMITLSWTFTTQSISDVLAQVRVAATGSTAIGAALGDTAALLGAGPGLANIYAGTLSIPYYLTNGAVATDPLNKFWQGPSNSNLTQLNAMPVSTSTETIPLLVSVPKTTKPGSGWPVAIFQHGITSDRSAMLAIADALAIAGFASVAIDMPLHGVAPTSPLYTGIERTFDLDLVNNTTRALGGDGTVDSSGQHYINLANLLVTRDNLRQSVADLFALYDALNSLDYDSGGADFDINNVYFVGHSLGAMVGATFLALESGVKDAVLGMPGGGIAKLLDGSATFGPVIADGLAAFGLVKGSANFESFMAAAQTIIDSGDPINYVGDAVVGRGLLLFEVVGDGVNNLPDQVIPNNVLADAPPGTVPAPLAGTDPFAALLGLNPVSSTTNTTSNQLAWIRFTAGDHASILNPAANAAVTSTMQAATAAFLATGGLSVTINDPSVVE